MYLVPFSSFARRAALSRGLDRFFDDALFDAARPAPRAPALDVTEDDKAYTVTLEVPGVAKEDVQIAVDGRRVSIQAESKSGAEKKDGERALYTERRVQSFSRSFVLPAEVIGAETSAKLDNGVLTLVVPKAAPRTAAKIAVN